MPTLFSKKSTNLFHSSYISNVTSTDTTEYYQLSDYSVKFGIEVSDFEVYLSGYFTQKKKKVVGHKGCVLIFSTNLSETFLILRTERNMIINVHRFSCNVPVILFRF